jgi:hypothetical protein
LEPKANLQQWEAAQPGAQRLALPEQLAREQAPRAGLASPRWERQLPAARLAAELDLQSSELKPQPEAELASPPGAPAEVQLPVARPQAAEPAWLEGLLLLPSFG